MLLSDIFLVIISIITEANASLTLQSIIKKKSQQSILCSNRESTQNVVKDKGYITCLFILIHCLFFTDVVCLNIFISLYSVHAMNVCVRTS